MTSYLLDWANLLLRWLHVIVAIAWIGASFHFVHLDDSLTPPDDDDLKRRGVDGEAWAVHGGGFYHSTKYFVAPAGLPAKLHWSFWESYTTWLSGFALLCVLYFANASTFLVDPARLAWSPGAAIAGALAYLVAGWVVYDGICRLVGRNADGSVGGDRRVGVLVFLYVCVAAWVACRCFAGRAAFLLTGAMLATVMSANVAMMIIPGQRKVVAALRAGQPVDPNLGRRGKQRSVHNTYLTLPVLVAMLSNHWTAVTSHRHNALALVGLMAAGALVRAFFVFKHKAPADWRLAGAAVALLAAVGWLVAPAPDEVAPASDRAAPVTGNAAPAPVAFADVQSVVRQRCLPCHNNKIASKGVRFTSPALIAAQSTAIHQQAVVLQAMPMNNATHITPAERALLGRWVDAGAPVR